MVEQVKMMLEEKHRVDDERVREETELELLKAETEGYYRHYFVEALKHIYSNVEIHIGPAQQRTQRNMAPVWFKTKTEKSISTTVVAADIKPGLGSARDN